MKAYFLTLLILTSIFQILFGQNNPFINLQEVKLLQDNCELEKWYEGFKEYKKDYSYEEHIKLLTQKIDLIELNNCIKNEQIDTLTGRLYFHLGVAYRITNLVEQALESYNKAYDYFNFYSNNKSLEATCRKLGSIWMFKKDFNKANNYFESAERICIKNKFDSSLHKTYNEMMINYSKWKRPNDTLVVNEIYLKAKAINHPKIKEEDRLGIETNRALIYSNVKNYAKALNICIDSEIRYRKLLSENKSEKKVRQLQTNLAINILNIAEFYTELSQFDKADDDFDEVKILIEQDKILINDKHFYQNYLSKKAVFYEKQNQYETALEQYQKILQSISLGFTYQTIYQNPSLDQIFGNPYLLTTLADKAEIFKKMYHQSGDKENLKHALDCYRLSYTAADEMRKNYSFEDANTYLSDYTYSYYEKAIELCQTLANVSPEQKSRYQQKAFEIAQRSSMKTLFWEINNRAADNHLDQTVKANKNKLQQQLINLESDLRNAPDSSELASQRFEVRTELDKINTKAKETVDAYFESQFCHLSDFGLEPKALQKRLQPNQALLNYFYGDSLIYCYLFTQNQFEIIEIENPDLISKNINAFRDSISNYQNSTKPGYQLYQQLLGKALAEIPVKNSPEWSITKSLTNMFSSNNNKHPSKANLIIIPDGRLSALPFEALNQSEKNGDYLLNDYTISYDLHSSFLNKQTKQDNIENINMLGCSVADFSNYKPKLDFLPNAKKEVETAIALLGGKHLHPATKTEFLKQFSSYTIVHISTHASADTLDAANARIYFSPYENESDNILSRNEILNHQCPAEMIVLSACQTGYGKHNKGEGVASLARAFRTIGSQSELMSLWAIGDNSTYEILIYFYKLLKDGMPKNEALREAKLNYIGNQSEDHKMNPINWAGLVLQGDVKPLY